MNLEFKFGQATPGVVMDREKVSVGLLNGWVAGRDMEAWVLPGEGQCLEYENLSVWRGVNNLCGVGCLAVTADTLRQSTRNLYRQILHLCQSYTVHRFWNFVPGINHKVAQAGTGDIDQYMLFCAGRAEAYQSLAGHGGGDFSSSLPPASAVGTTGDKLWVVFMAGLETLQAIENPLQTPAYRYPKQYGPRPPSFARGGVVAERNTLIVSGTASIRDSESLYLGDVVAQTHLAIDNLEVVNQAAGISGNPADTAKILRVYLCRAEDWDKVAGVVARRLSHLEDQLTVVQADICRPELLVEIEMQSRYDTRAGLEKE